MFENKLNSTPFSETIIYLSTSNKLKNGILTSLITKAIDD